MKRFTGWQIGLMVGAILIVPPLLCSAGLVIQDVSQNFSGICPGIMDIEPYPCTLSEYVARNTISPFALAAHLAIFIGWMIPSGFVMTAAWGIWWLGRKQRSTAV